MYRVEFYEKASGESDVWDFLEELRTKAQRSKDARIQYKQVSFYIQLLQESGTLLPETVTKHLVEDIWELRPGNNRVFYFCYEQGTFVLLHHFRKKSQKNRIEKLNAPRRSVMITEPGRRGLKNENMERLQRSCQGY